MDKLNTILHDCYREMYANADPKADFDVLVEKAETNELGQKVIPFNDYLIDRDVFQEILDRHRKKIKPTYLRKAFRIAIVLGCSPKFKP
jgi:hypothetical protein